MNLIRKITFVLLLLSSTVMVHAQTKSFTDVLKIRLRSATYIKKNGDITGYAFFYMVDKLAKGQNSYVIRILDANLTEIANHDLVESKNIVLAESSYDNNSLLLKFFDPDKKLVKYYCYDMSAKLIYSKTEPVDAITIQMVMAQMQVSGEVEMSNLYSINGNGYVDYATVKNSTWGYTIRYLPSNGSEGWIAKSAEKSKDLEVAAYLSTDSLQLYSYIAKKPSLMSSDVKTYIHATNLSNGNITFETTLDDEGHKHLPYKGFTDKNGILKVTGLYFGPKDNIFKDNSLGIFLVSIDQKGNIVERKYLAWMESLSKFLPVSENGKIKNMGYLFFHNVFKLNDGKIYAVCEAYRKKFTGVNISASVEDLLILEFSSSFEMTNAKIFDKTASSIALEQGYAMMDPQMLGLLLKNWGMFDYSYTQFNKDQSRFFTAYIDLAKEKGEKAEWEAVFISKSTTDDYTVDKIQLELNNSNVSMMAAKPGYVMIAEYFKKTKTLSLRLEKINY